MLERNSSGVWRDPSMSERALDKEVTKTWLDETAEGQEFRVKFLQNPENIQKIVEQIEFHGLDVSFSNLSFVYCALRDSGQFESVRLTKRGIPLTESQQRWSDYTKFANENSSAACKELARIDPGFRSFMQKNLQRELQGVGDSMVANGNNPHLLIQGGPSDDAKKNTYYVEFAKRYAAMSSAQVKSARSIAANPLTAEQFITDTERAIELRLI